MVLHLQLLSLLPTSSSSFAAIKAIQVQTFEESLSLWAPFVRRRVSGLDRRQVRLDLSV